MAVTFRIQQRNPVNPNDEIVDPEIYVDEYIFIDGSDTYRDMLTWLIDNQIVYHHELHHELDSGSCAYFILSDNDAVSFKLRWA